MMMIFFMLYVVGAVADGAIGVRRRIGQSRPAGDGYLVEE